MRAAAATDGSIASLQAKSTSLLHQIETWVKIQEIYTPSLRAYRTAYWDDWRAQCAASGKSAEIRPEKIHLLLPSSKISNVVFDPRLLLIEYQLRHGQAVDALGKARETARLNAYVSGDKRRFVTGQRAHTRSNGILKRLEERKKGVRIRYEDARKALIALAPATGVTNANLLYPELKETDIVSLRVDPSLQRPEHPGSETSEGRRRIPWIWRHFSIGSTTDEDTSLEESESCPLCHHLQSTDGLQPPRPPD